MSRFGPFRHNQKKEISITYMSGPQDGQKVVFDQPEPGNERVISIGRREGSDIHISFDNQVSRLHARLGCVAVATPPSDSNTMPYIMTFWLEDGGSRNGTYLENEDEPIEGRVSLRPGVLFRIGRTWMRLDFPLSFGS
jgi:pSer/pThr/pTyr-binding forkhead associated (FHA) protein